MAYALGSSLLLLLLGLVTRRLLVDNFGPQITTASQVVSQLFNFFSIAEFGVGSVISYRLYEQIAAKNEEKISKYMSMYKWAYRVVGLVIAGGLIFLLRRFGEGLPTAEALWKGAVGALAIAFCWALGVWAAVGPEPSDDDGGQDGEAIGNVGSCAAWRGRVLCFVLLLGAFALVCSSQISDMLGGECSLARGFGGMLLKAMAVAAVVVPVWLDSRRSKW